MNNIQIDDPASAKKSSILVVEDVPDERVGLCRLLEHSGFSVRSAADGLEALQQVRSESFDLLLVDVGLPRMSGLEMLSRLPDRSRPKVLVITADHTARTVLEALREHAEKCIEKPVEPKQLLQVVKTAMESPPIAGKIRVLSADPRFVELSFPCDPQVAGCITDYLSEIEADLPANVRQPAELAFREMLMNAIEWGGHLDRSSDVQVTVLRTEALLLYRISDPGTGFDPSKLEHAAVNYPPDDPISHTEVREKSGLRPGGFGILLARSLVDELIYNEAHNEVVLVKFLKPPRAA